jgi:hypothetical protein
MSYSSFARYFIYLWLRYNCSGYCYSRDEIKKMVELIQHATSEPGVKNVSTVTPELTSLHIP